VLLLPAQEQKHNSLTGAACARDRRAEPDAPPSLLGLCAGEHGLALLTVFFVGVRFMHLAACQHQATD
jgi:hypothetical protein